jgi:predicted acylesterase/phospholipase RssA
VLGGGGARGFAHLGALRAFEEQGVPIDVVGGTSIGALAGALWAIGLGADERDRLAIEKLAGTRSLIGWTLPIASLSSAKKLTQMLQSDDLFGDADIEDLPNPYFAVSASYSTGQPVVHESGSLWFAARASISLPGIMPPVWRDGDLLVDGGVVNNVPVDLMRARVAGTVFAVNLRGATRRGALSSFDPTISGWRLLADRLHPRREAVRLPGPAAMMLRSKELGGKQAHASRLALADLVLEPPVDGVDNLDFKSGRNLIEPAYRATCEALEAWCRAQEAGAGAPNL